MTKLLIITGVLLLLPFSGLFAVNTDEYVCVPSGIKDKWNCGKGFQPEQNSELDQPVVVNKRATETIIATIPQTGVLLKRENLLPETANEKSETRQKPSTHYVDDVGAGDKQIKVPAQSPSNAPLQQLRRRAVEPSITRPIVVVEKKSIPTVQVASNNLESIPASSLNFNKLNSNHYTIQVLGVHYAKYIDDYIVQNGLEQSKTMKVRTLRDGRDWWLLLHSDYPSFSEAQLALNQLPQTVRNNTPWIRKIGSVQKLVE